MVDGIIRFLEYLTHNPIFQGTMIGIAVIVLVVIILVVCFFIAVMRELFGR